MEQLTPPQIQGDGFFCRFCGKNFGRISGRTHHENLCTRNPASSQPKELFAFSCDDCGCSFKHKWELNCHEAYDCGVTHRCRICNRTYSRLYNLRAHFRKGLCKANR